LRINPEVNLEVEERREETLNLEEKRGEEKRLLTSRRRKEERRPILLIGVVGELVPPPVPWASLPPRVHSRHTSSTAVSRVLHSVFSLSRDESLGFSSPPCLGGKRRASSSRGVSVTRGRGEESMKPPVVPASRKQKIGWTSS